MYFPINNDSFYISISSNKEEFIEQLHKIVLYIDSILKESNKYYLSVNYSFSIELYGTYFYSFDTIKIILFVMI